MALGLQQVDVEPPHRLLGIYDKLGISSRVELVLYAVSGTEPIGEPSKSMAYSASA
ncbi:MAG: hypothetical protein WBR26_01645 [Candidatus Acidiferrum sp.]